MFFFFTFFPNVNSGAKEQKMAWNDNYVCCTPYLSNHTSHDHVFCYTSLKWWHLQIFFSFFLILVFLIVRGREGEGGGNRTENGPKWEKILSLYLRNCTTYDCVFWNSCVKWWYHQQFFPFFQKSDFLGFSKFINEWQKEILRCAPPSHVCDFLISRLETFSIFPTSERIFLQCEIM